MAQQKSEKPLKKKSRLDEVLDRMFNGLKKAAKKLDQDRKIYFFNSLFDSINVDYGFQKTAFSLLFMNSKHADKMHNWLVSPAGIVLTVLESISIIALLTHSGYYQADEACDYITLDEAPTQDILKSLKFSSSKTRQAYVWACGQLYFVNRSPNPVKQKCDPTRETTLETKGEITGGLIKKLDLDKEALEQFKNNFKPQLTNRLLSQRIPQSTPCSLSKNQIALIQGITKYNHQNSIRDYLAWIGPYVRDFIKAIRSAQQGSRSLVAMLENLAKLKAHHLNFLNLPLALASCAVAALLKMWLRRMIENRKARQEFNKALLDDFLTQKKNGLLPVLKIGQIDEWQQHYKMLTGKIQAQPIASRAAAYSAVALSGLIDTTYLYIGLLSLSTFAWPAFVAMSVFCIIFCVAQILVRVYEEYTFQCKLKITILDAEIAILEAQIECLIEQLVILDRELQQDSVYKLNALLKDAYYRFKSSRVELNHINTKHNVSAMLEGIKAGLYAFTAVSAGFFAANAFMGAISAIFLVSAAFPPALIIAMMAAGAAAIIAFTCYTFYKYYQHREEHKPKNVVSRELEAYINNPQTAAVPKLKDVRSYFAGTHLTPSPPSYYADFLEMLRAFLAGPGKALKGLGFMLTPTEYKGDDERYHESLPVLIMACIAAVFYALVFALRALAKGFGRLPVVEEENLEDTKEKGFRDDRIEFEKDENPNSFFNEAHSFHKNDDFVEMKEGYDLELMSSLPNDNIPLKGKIYLSQAGEYTVLDHNGKVKNGHFRINLIGNKNLSDILTDRQFINAILKVTSEAGHTLKGSAVDAIEMDVFKSEIIEYKEISVTPSTPLVSKLSMFARHTISSNRELRLESNSSLLCAYEKDGIPSVTVTKTEPSKNMHSWFSQDDIKVFPEKSEKYKKEYRNVNPSLKNNTISSSEILVLN